MAAALAAVIGLIAGPAGAATRQYAVRSLGPLGAATVSSQAVDINEAGQVVGYFTLRTSPLARPFLWERGGRLVELADLPDNGYARAINNAGQVLVESVPDTPARPSETYLWSRGSGLTALADLPGGVPLRSPTDINDAGQLTAGTVLWSPGIGPVDLGIEAAALDGAGRVVGSGATGPREVRAYLWTPETRATWIDKAPDAGRVNVATDINDRGQILVATSAARGGAYLWEAEAGYTDLGVLPGGTFSRGTGLNEAGQIVGYSFGGSILGRDPFLWEAGHGLRPLEELIRPGSSWDLINAWAINERGQIVGSARRRNGAEQAVLLTPIPLPPALPLLGAALWGLGLLCRRGGAVQRGSRPNRPATPPAPQLGAGRLSGFALHSV